MMMKVALITGASSGIGRALAEKFASNGVKVIAAARSQSKLSELANLYPHVQAVCCDLSNEDGRNKLLNSVSGRLDYLVNNAGIESHVGNIELMSEESLKEIMETNLVAPMILTARLIAKKCIDKESRILGTSSRAGDQAFRGVCAYGVTKSGLDAFHRALVEEGYLAATVIPGEVDTQIQKGLREAVFPLQQFFIDAKAEGRLLPPGLSAQFLYYLLCRMSAEAFSGKKHNIYDRSLWSLWLSESETVTTPAGEREHNMRTRDLDAGAFVC